MFPPNKPPMMPPGAQAAPPQPAMAGAPPQPGSPPPGAGAPPPGGGQGPQDVANIGFNQAVQNILLSRIQKMPPQALKILDGVLTQQTIPAFKILLPELTPLFDHILQSSQPGPIGQPGQPPAQGGAPAPAAGGQPPAVGGGAPSAAQPGGQPGQGSGDDDEDEESNNPLVSGPASQGLIG